MYLKKIHQDSKYRILCLQLDSNSIHIFNGFVPLSVNSFIIESSNALVIIDTQLSLENAEILKNYAQSLNKPIAKVIITHAHYDHYSGLPAFKHNVTYALKETITDMNKLDLKENAIPLNPLGNTFMLDGLNYECHNFQNAHCPNHLVLYINEINTLVLGDLAQENVHLLPMNLTAFISALTTIKSKYMEKAKYLLTGHGRITTPETLDKNLLYMETCYKVYTESRNNEEYQDKVFATFPDMIKISPPLYYLFKGNPIAPVQ